MSTYSVGQMNQLGDALEKVGFTPDDVTKLRSFSELGKIKEVLYGRAEIKQLMHVIDCDADPFIPDGWTVEAHRKGGQFQLDPTKVTLYLSKKQKSGVVEGNKLRQELVNRPVLNANVLDYLLKNPHLIPQDWKVKYVFFWGTVYRHSRGGLCVRCLSWDGSQWHWSYRWLADDFYGNDPAAVGASN